MVKLDELNICTDIKEIKDGQLIVIKRKRDKRRILCRVKSVLNKGTGEEEVLLSGKNDYFVWNMMLDGSSWVWRVWTLPIDIEITSITNNMNEFPR